MEHRLATDDEEYPIGFRDMLEDPEPEPEADYWSEDEDYYDFPEDDGDGLFDPMEAEREPS